MVAMRSPPIESGYRVWLRTASPCYQLVVRGSPESTRLPRQLDGVWRASTYAHARAPDWRTTATRLTAATSYWSALWISSGETANTVPDMTSDARPVNLAMVCCALPLTAITASSWISNGASSNPGNASRVPVNRRPNVAVRSEEHTSELQSLAYLVC